MGPFDYRVEWTHGLKTLEMDASGMCLPEYLKIRVNHELPDQAKLECLWHEIAHAVNYVACIDDSTTEEDMVRRTSPVWLAVFRDNPELLDLLIDYSRGEL